MSVPSTSSKKTIAIIGAGVSGLQAARTILTHPNAASYEVLIFEARNRIGGRVQTKREWGYPLDFGANFIHGTVRNPIADVAEKVGSTFVYNLAGRGYYNDKGKALDIETSRIVFRKVWEYAGEASDYSRENEVDKDASVSDFCQKKLQEDTELEDGELRKIVSSATEMLTGLAACDLDKLSLRYFWMEDDLPGDTPFVDSSYDPIVQYIAHPATSQNIIKFNTKITAVEVNASAKNSITLRSAALETFHADSLIVTIPLGCLKNDAIKFTPVLPDSVGKAISNLGFDVLEKVFIRFSKPWWLLPIDEEEKAVALEFYRFPSKLSQDQNIPKGGLGFFSLARTNNPLPVFGIFISTKLAKYLVSLPKEELKSMLQTHYIVYLPNYDANNPACQILDLDCSVWSQDPLSGFGSYTHIPAGSDTGDENMRILSEKILSAGDGGIWFAGEHTADTEIIDGLKYTTMATVTGAYKSGERAANHVLHTYENAI